MRRAPFFKHIAAPFAISIIFGERDSLTDGKNPATGFTFDKHGQLQVETPPSGPVLGYGYTPGGKLNSKTDRLNRVWNATYDDAGRMLNESFPGPQGTIQHGYTFGKQGDGTDQMLKADDPNGRTDFSYGHRGRMEESTDEALGRKLARHYDNAGNLIRLDLKDASGAVLQSCTYVPDERNRVVQFTDWAGDLFVYKYNAADQMTKVEITPQGKASVMITGAYVYDGAGRLLSITYRKRSTGPILAKVAYNYDEAGNRTTKKTQGSDSSYGYDALNQITSDTNSGDTRGPLSFVYDKAGNRQSQTWNAGTQSYVTNGSLNHLDSTNQGPQGAFSFSYDAEGNRLAKTVNGADGVAEIDGSTGYQWDGKNRLAQVALPDSTTVTYAYDYMNRLVSRTQGSEVRTFLIGSGNQVLEEILNDSHLAVYSWGADGLTSRTDANGQTLFYLKDALGSVMAIVDVRGAMVQSYEYSAYGESLSGKEAVNAFRFVGGAGGYADDSTGLVQFWNRWYDPRVGRWMSEDPIRQRGGVNLLGYVSNSPSVASDPSGLLKRYTIEFTVNAGAGVGLLGGGVLMAWIWDQNCQTSYVVGYGGATVGWEASFGYGGTYSFDWTDSSTTNSFSGDGYMNIVSTTFGVGWDWKTEIKIPNGPLINSRNDFAWGKIDVTAGTFLTKWTEGHTIPTH